jgi:general secretion pathway protein G
MLHNHMEALRKGRKAEGGFTLIELLITIVILGVLAGIVVFAVSGINDTSKTAACKSDKKNVEVAGEARYANSSPHAYAASIAQLKTEGFLHDVPSSTDYTITYTVAADGKSFTVGPATCP